MGSVFKKKSAPRLDLSKMDYRQAVEDRVKPARDAQLALLQQLEKQTGGQGPSLADAEMRAATNRNLSQLLAATAASRGVPAQSALMSASSAAGRQLAEATGKARAQEMQNLQALRGNTALTQQGQDLAQVMQPGQLLAGGELKRFAADVQRVNTNTDAQRRLLGAMIGMGGQALGSMSSPSAGGNKVVSSTDVAAPGLSYGAGDSGLLFAACGGEVPGYAEGGDNPENDVIPAMLSPGEIVLPRSITKAENAPAKAKTFVEALMKEKYTDKKKPKSFLDVLHAKKRG